jgi:hypothetical protein
MNIVYGQMGPGKQLCGCVCLFACIYPSIRPPSADARARAFGDQQIKDAGVLTAVALMEPRSATPWDSGGEGPDIPLMFLILRTRHDRDTVSRTCMQVQMHLGV